MAIKVDKSGDGGEAIVEHFEALPFARQTEVLKQLQAIVADAAGQERAKLLEQLRALDALAGRPEERAPHSERATRGGGPRGKAAIVFYDPKSGNSSTGRGSMAKWLKEKKEAGEDLEQYRVSDSNPLPDELKD